MSAGWRSVRPMRRRSEHNVEGRDVRGRPLNVAACFCVGEIVVDGSLGGGISRQTQHVTE